MITYEQNNLRFNVRTIAIIFNGDKVLLQTVEELGHWLLPGGRAELLEPAVDGIRREMREELDVEIEVERLVWVVENFFEDAGKSFHQIAFYFLATLPPGCHLCEKTEPFEGYQMNSYRYRAERGEVGEPVQRMRPRALMVPPGMPDYFSRHRLVDAGSVQLVGRAWSGDGSIVRVEFQVDDEGWQDADLGPEVGPHAWRSWSHAWDAEPGEHVLYCRATDSAGNTQPTEAPWNAGGFGNNMVQTVPVTVR